MARNIKALLRDGVTGEMVGRIMIEDLVDAHKRNAMGDIHAHPLSEEDKHLLVGSLTNLNDIDQYTNYKYLHDYLANVPQYYMMVHRSYEVNFWQVYRLVETLYFAEQDNLHKAENPVIMTARQYEAAQAAGTLPPGGVAVLQGDGHETYTLPPTYFERDFLAGPFIPGFQDSIRENLYFLQEHLRTCFVVLTVVQLIGEMIEVPEVPVLLRPVNLSYLRMLNDMMQTIPAMISRPDPIETEALRAGIRGLLRPIAEEGLQPAPEAIERVRGLLSVPFFNGGSPSHLYTLLRNGGDAM